MNKPSNPDDAGYFPTIEKSPAPADLHRALLQALVRESDIAAIMNEFDRAIAVLETRGTAVDGDLAWAVLALTANEHRRATFAHRLSVPPPELRKAARRLPVRDDAA